MQLGQLTGGNTLGRFAAVSVYLMVLLSNADYFLVIGQTLGLAFYDTHICLSNWILIACVLVLLLQQFRTFEELKWLLWVNMATITLTILISLSYVGHLGLDVSINPGEGTETIASSLTWNSFATAFSKIAFAYSGQFLYLEFIVEMKNPAEFPQAIYRFAGPYQLGLYVITACTGYHLKGQNAVGFMVNWVPFNGWLRFTALLLFFHVVIVYVVGAQILSKVLHRYFFPDTFIKRNVRARIHWFGITLSLTIFFIGLFLHGVSFFFIFVPKSPLLFLFLLVPI